MGKQKKSRSKRDKRPIIPKELTIQKVPRFFGEPNLEDRYLAWRFSKADLGGPYSCGTFTYDDFLMLWDKLRSFEKMNSAELWKGGSFHEISVGDIGKEAQARLQAVALDDVDYLYSFRMNATCRLWCVKHENLMSLLWWDKDHQVYPVSKKGT